MSLPPPEEPEDQSFIEGIETSGLTKPLTPEELTRRKSAGPKPLLFTGESSGPLVFQGVSPELDEIETENSISDTVWKIIKSGKILNYLPSYLLDTDNTEKLKIPENKDPNRCILQDGRTNKITMTRNPDTGTVGFLADSSKEGGIEPIRLMIALAKCAAELEINLRLNKTLGPNPTEEERKTARENLLKTNPKLLHFTINPCANAKDVALMLKEMKNGDPKLEATLTPEVIEVVKKEMATLPQSYRKIIQEQLEKQNSVAQPSPPPKKPN